VTARLEQQFLFLTQADALKKILRATPVLAGERLENSGEHSWHIALYAMVLADQAGPDVNIARVIEMLLIHDIVEIDAGDTPLHGQHDPKTQVLAEEKAADRLFGLLPPDQATRFRALWNEFEDAQTPDAIFAKALDRVQPVLQNIAAGGGSWTDYNVTIEQLESRVGDKVAKGAPKIWDFVHAKARHFFNK
jgi:putative hydrolases of HD superfamily|tara:strand:- start:1043 stop:1618 length:576 start_codon:yes stop_codon:yes gene_type:complete